MLVNFLISHPGVCISSGETHKVFKPGTRFDKGFLRLKKRFFYDYPIRLAVGQDFFRPNLVEPRKPVPQYIMNYIDHLMYHGRFLARIATHNLLQYEGVEYSDEELAKCRMVTKGLNGIVFTVDMFREMYPDAVFFALIRNGLAVCEGRSRRGYPVAKFAQDYHDIVTRMLQYEAEMPNYHILKYEDLVAAPLEMFNKVYELADLDVSEVRKIRLESKATMDAHGNHKLERGHDREVFWYELDQIHTHIQPNVNKNQIKNFNAKDKSQFLSVSGDVMQKLEYETD